MNITKRQQEMDDLIDSVCQPDYAQVDPFSDNYETVNVKSIPLTVEAIAKEIIARNAATGDPDRRMTWTKQA